MAIQRVEVFQLSQPISAPTGPSGATYRERRSVLVRLRDGDGLDGWGETYARAGVAAVIEEVGALLLGRDAADARPLLDTLRVATTDGLAISALAIALDDLRARRLGVPVATLYGGRRRDSVRGYASSGGYVDGVDPEQSWPDEVAAAVGDGFTACKIRIGRFAPTRELPILAKVRGQVGPDVELMVDANGAYTVPRAREVARGLADLSFRWLEEPLIRFRGGLAYPGYEHLGGLGIAIAAYEGLESRGAFDSYLTRTPVDIVQPDVAICGGIGELLFVAELAALRGRQCVPHAWGGAVLLAATLQAVSLLPEPSELDGPESPVLEVDRFENPMRTRLAHEPLTLTAGRMPIPDGPGLGITVDEDFVRHAAG
ncbi:mandelate racemase/muconate lactonizing enzyme family protein [Asanoa iriomotensis]|uniref:D-galactarolactone cycloisomerase n=1 Tax=Asanoa iriomotensis TaxID=234613 RepID=A0ABQ4C132_9ACTN|nr:mandelate racemase/muconate lactonizing enzyme family protein [Asanoa iriomotensis]GIF56141.1 D-galactarolactone cycloisomerase [Asanoa iriomotensis]